MVRQIPLSEVASLAGQELGVSAWHQVTQSQINQFADATGDFEWLHVDVARATREMGGTVAHGFLTLSLLPALWGQIARVTGYSGGYSYGLDRVRFTSPVKEGARVRLRVTLLPPKEKQNGTLVGINCVVEVEGQERPALIADWYELFFP